MRGWLAPHCHVVDDIGTWNSVTAVPIDVD